MFARSTTVRAATPESVDAGIVHIRDNVLPEMMQIDGWVGMSMMTDRESGDCIVTSSWESEAAMQGSRKLIEPIRARAVDVMGGTADFDEWEVAVMHRDHPTHEGAAVRAAWLQTDPANISDLITTFRDFALPQLEQLDGFCSASFLVNRATGAAVSSTCCESRAALASNRQQAASVRDAGTRQAGATVLRVGEYDLSVAHLRVPELV